MATADPYAQIYDAYKKNVGYAPEKAGFDYWKKEIDAGKTIDWDAQFAIDKANPEMAARHTNIKKAQDLTGFKGNIFDPSALDTGSKGKILTDAYKSFAGRRPDEAGFDYWLKDFDNGFSNYTFSDEFDRAFSDLDDRLTNLNVRGQQDVYDYSKEAEGSLADMLKRLMGEMGGGGAGGNGLDPYMNPYLDSVLKGALGDLSDTAAMDRNRLGSSAFSAGAYGDGRHGIESGVLTENLIKNVGDLSNQVRAQGYESSMGWKDKDIDRQMAAAFQNAGLENTWFNNNLNGATTASNIANNSAGLGFQYADMLTGLDSYDRNWLQQQLNSDFEDFWAKDSWDANQLQSFLSLISGVPGQTSGYSYSPNYSMWEGVGTTLANPQVTGGINDFFGNLFAKKK